MSGLDDALIAVNLGILSVDQDGRVWRHKSGPRHKLSNIQARRTECKFKSGYLGVVVRRDGEQFACLTHRLVWTALQGLIPAGMDINHVNGNKRDNSPNNLEVGTRSENLYHAYKIGLSKRSGALTFAQKDEIVSLRRQGLAYSEIGRRTGRSISTAWRAVQSSKGLQS